MTWQVVAWTIPAVVGLLFTAWMLRDIWIDRQLLIKSKRNGLSRLQVDRWLRSEAIIVIIHLNFTIVGAAAWLDIELAEWVFSGLFISVPSLLVLRSFGDRLVRRAVKKGLGLK